MPKPKTLIKHGKKKNKEQVLRDADDYLAAGVEHEDAAGKWRAGDAAKSLRFFSRAIDVYREGLTKWPQNLDLAYNKARVELEIATHPALIRHLDVPRRDLLEQALASHRYALTIDPRNSDTLFNTAQVVVTVAEELAKDDDRVPDVLKLLEEALELQAECYGVQELRYEETQQHQQAMVETQTNVQQGPSDPVEAPSSSVSTSAAEEQWFSVIEDTTVQTLIDTVVAQLSTLTTLTSILAETLSLPQSPTLPWISTYSDSLTEKLDFLTTSTPATDPINDSAQEEIQLTRKQLTTRLLEASYRHSMIDLPTYKAQLSNIFTPTPTTYALLLAQAEALLSFSSALLEKPTQQPPTTLALDRWTALASAISTLSNASKLPKLDPADLARTHLLRADASLLQHALSHPPIAYATATKHAPQLLANAETFYRNAARLYLSASSAAAAVPQTSSSSLSIANAATDPEDAEAARQAAFRCTVAQVLQGKSANLGVELGGKVDLGGASREWVVEQIGEMVDEGLVREGFGAGLMG